MSEKEQLKALLEKYWPSEKEIIDAQISEPVEDRSWPRCMEWAKEFLLGESEDK